ncbi:MAG TPA: glycosyl hydrolase, partial [Candidatus Angelobacter sp.]|nr:glycosyl hydrolase [Candidatus Angelobacter sp.]
DGGKTWKKILYVDDGTGAVSLAMDPSNPSTVYAAMWQISRKHWTFSSGGPGSGMYKSTDGGASWTNITHRPGLPTGIFGKVGIAVAPSKPNVVYALIQADYKGQAGGLFRSDDAGQSWKLINNSMDITQRAFYYMTVFVDPKDPNTIYLPNVGVYVSHDAGKKLTALHPPHGDNHVLWINPKNPQIFIEGNDGGATVTLNGGKAWSSEDNQPTGQFYHANLDDQFPFHIYGAQQDRGSVEAPSAVPSGTIPPVWKSIQGGEMSWVVPTPGQPWVTYGSGYYSMEWKENRRTGLITNVSPWPAYKFGLAGSLIKYRYGWIHHAVVFATPKELLMGANVLLETTDEGIHWKPISPDLTRNDKSKQVAAGGPITKDNTGVEVYDTIFSVTESPQQKDLIWAGSDDGLIHITTDGGKNWSNVTPKAMPEWGTVSMIEASPFAAGTAYVAVQRHKLDDFAPYIFKTTDFGKTWTSIVNGIPAGDYVHAVREDHKRKGLLYAATEKGVYVSFDDGAKWEAMQTNLPPSPVWDLIVHDNDIAAATHGRAFWVLDDISPLQQYKPEIASEDTHLYAPDPANHTQFFSGFFGGSGESGQNPPAGAVIYYSLKNSLKPPERKQPGASAAGEKPTEAAPAAGSQPSTPASTETAEAAKPSPITLEILDQKGQVVRKYPPKKQPGEEGGDDEGFGFRPPERGLPTDAGLNRFVWDLRYEGATKVPKSPLWAGSTDGPEALPGNYQVRLTVQGKSYTAPLEIKPDPRLKVTQQDLEKQFDLLIKIRDRVTQTHDTINQIRDIRSQITALNKKMEGQPQAKAIADAGKQLDKKMTDVEEVLIQTKAKSGQDVLNYPIRLNNYLVALGGVVASADSAPTQASYDVFDMLSKQLDEQLAKWKQILNTDVPAYNELVRKQDVPAILTTKPSAQPAAAGGKP